jgi:aspartate-semialdehyde dehydrogenase
MMETLYNLVIVGATGLVGETLIELLTERDFPVGQLQLVASADSAGQSVRFGGKSIKMKTLDQVDWTGVDFAFFSAGADIALEYAPIAAAAGAFVIDNSTAFRADKDVPLVVPEVNPEALKNIPRKIIANPNCSTIQLVVALKPLHDVAQITRINVCTYQAVSGTGKAAIEELAGQTAQLLNGLDATVDVYPVQIAFNCFPHIDSFEPNGYTKEEMKIVNETRKILGDETIAINPTAVRIPAFFGHSEAVHIETKTKLTAEAARKLLKKAPGVEVIDKPDEAGYPTAVGEATGSDSVYVGRIREDISHPTGLDLWIVADNVRKGAALNSIQIAEHLKDLNYTQGDRHLRAKG